MAQELQQYGIVDVPGTTARSPASGSQLKPEKHHYIGQESDSRTAIHLGEWQIEHSDDTAIQV